MLANRFLALSLAIVVMAVSGAVVNGATVGDLVGQVSQVQYTTYQLDLQDMGLGLYGGASYNQGYRNRYNSNGSATESLGFKEANLYLNDRFTAMGLSVTNQSDYKNVVAELPGTDPDPAIRNRVYIISGHYDHPEGNFEAPGGDDNASGTAGVLDAARIMSQYRFRSTIRFVAWGAEEGWMRGSWDYVRNVIKANSDPTHQDLAGMLNMDMILRPFNNTLPGDPIDLDIGTRVAYPSCVAWADKFRAAATTYAPSLIVDPQTHGSLYYEWYASDQGPFMSQEDGFLYPGLMVAENTAYEIWGGAYPYYHTANDASDKSNHYDYAFAADVVRTAIGMIGTEAQLQIWAAGDANHDGLVNALDMDAVFAHFGAGNNQWDVNLDGTVSQTDVDELVRDILHTGYGDGNLDHKVDFLDFQTLLNNWQEPSGWATGDWTGDGTCDFLDFQEILDNWNPDGFPGASVPEPASAAMFLLGAVGMLGRRK